MSHAGRLLVATPLIGDTTFERTVVAVLAHNADGAFGVVLNRPGPAAVHDLSEVSDIDDGWFDLAAAPAVVFVGGPVGVDSVLAIASGPASGGDVVRGIDDLGLIDLSRPPPAGVEGSVRFFAGSAGWSPGQLEDEVADGAWWPVDGSRDDVLGSDPSNLWARVLRRQRGTVAWFANCPDDPTAN